MNLLMRFENKLKEECLNEEDKQMFKSEKISGKVKV
jgi:hypothetical protein